MTWRELTIKNYTSFMPKFKTLPNKHPYVLEFWGKFFDKVPANGIDSNDRKVLQSKMDATLQRIKNMSDADFDAQENCAEKFCLLFHNANEPYVKEEFLYGDLKLRYIPVENLQNVQNRRYDIRLFEKINGQWVDQGLLE